MVDGFSTDRTWEILREAARFDLRFHLFRQKPLGPYAAINFGVERAKGDYFYVATADDTMADNLLSEMLNLLESNATCDVAHCALQFIDENGDPHSRSSWQTTAASIFYKEVLGTTHVRRHPTDGFLYCCLNTVYHSLTQLVFRRNVFQKVGLFPTEFGSYSDFLWGMKVALVCDVVHHPQRLATWRIRADQLTDVRAINSSNHRKVLSKMIEVAWKDLLDKRKIRLSDLLFYYKLEEFILLFVSGKHLTEKAFNVFVFAFENPTVTVRFLLNLNSIRQQTGRFNRFNYARFLIKKYKLPFDGSAK